MTSPAVKEDAAKFLIQQKGFTDWVKAVLGEDAIMEDADLFMQLVDGVILCKAMQKISPSLIPRIKTPVIKKKATLTIWKSKENVDFFIQACAELGMSSRKRFATHDLISRSTLVPLASRRRIIDCVEELSKIACKDPKYGFSIKWPKIDAKTKFTEDEIQDAERLVEQHNAKLASAANLTASANASAYASASSSTKKPVDNIPKAERELKAAIRIQSIARGWFSRQKYRRMVRNQAYRDHVAQEILSTEKVYVESLQFLVTEVLSKLRADKTILTDNEIRGIFSEIDSILSLNTLLLQDLEKRVAKEWSVHQRLGDIFTQIANFLKIYTQYCANYNEAMRVLLECKKQPKFVKFLEEVKKKNAAFQQRSLEDFLIRPVQRVPRYFLLLQDLVKHTDKDHPDYLNLEQAAKKIQEIAGYINAKSREAENITKVIEIQDMIEGDYEPLAKPTRRFVKEGQVQELTKNTTRRVAVVLFLFNDVLVVTKVQGSSFLSTSKSKGQRLLFESSFDLFGAKLIDQPDSSSFQHMFELMRIKSKRSVMFAANSKENKEEWMNDIQQQIDEVTEAENEKDDRKTKSAMPKAAENMAKLEQQMAIVGSLGGSTEIMSPGGKKLTARERIAQMQNARKSLSGSSGSVSGESAPSSPNL